MPASLAGFVLVTALTSAHALHEAVNVTTVASGSDWQQQLVDAPPNSVVDFGDGVFEGACNVKLNKNVTLQSKTGRATIDCGSTGRHFEIGEHAFVAIQGLTMKNGWGKGGGCISVAGNLLVTDSTFQSCQASKAGGAVLVVERGSAAFENTRFLQNSAEDGGAISAKNCELQLLSGNSFTSNAATRFGGAIYAAETMSALIQDIEIVDNTAAHGGGLYLHNNLQTIYMTQIEMQTNTAKAGGGLYAHNSDVVLQLTGNQQGNKATSQAGGLAFVTSGSSLTVTSTDGATSRILENSAAQDGGAIACMDPQANDHLTITGNLIFRNNIAEDEGGAIFVGGCSLSVSGQVELSGNEAESGAAVFAEGSREVTLSGVTITDNIASGTSASEGGGGVYLRSIQTPVIIREATFARNTASSGGNVYISSTDVELSLTGDQQGNTEAPAKYGGFVFITGGGSLKMSSNGSETITISDFVGVDDGGIIYCSGDATGQMQVTVSGNFVFRGNHALHRGGAIFVDGCSLSVSEQVEFSGNHAEKTGGAVHAEGSHDVTLSGVTITDNTASGTSSGEGGGGVYLHSIQTPAMVTRATFARNTARSGGGLYAHNSDVVLELTGDQQGNKATSQAGGLAFVTSGSSLTVTSTDGATSRILENSAAQDGGAIACMDPHANAYLTITGNLIFRNNIAEQGGAISWADAR